MRTIFTSIPDPGDDLTGVPEDWNLGRHIELRWLPDDRHPYVVAEVVVSRIECDPDGTRHLHLVNAHRGECSSPAACSPPPLNPAPSIPAHSTPEEPR